MCLYLLVAFLHMALRVTRAFSDGGTVCTCRSAATRIFYLFCILTSNGARLAGATLRHRGRVAQSTHAHARCHSSGRTGWQQSRFATSRAVFPAHHVSRTYLSVCGNKVTSNVCPGPALDC